MHKIGSFTISLKIETEPNSELTQRPGTMSPMESIRFQIGDQPNTLTGFVLKITVKKSTKCLFLSGIKMKYRLYDYYTGELFGRTYQSFSKAYQAKEKLSDELNVWPCLIGVWEI
jgi:hypothetical protein